MSTSQEYVYHCILQFIETAPKTDDGYEEFMFEDVAEEVGLNFRTYT